MKYIRTKDGRISYLTREPNEELCDYEIITSKGTRTYRDESDVIKIADNIEELCDEYVVVHNAYLDNGKDIYYQVGSKACHRGDSYYDFTFQQVRTGRRNISGILYGAIWTDKGLIYVAKMNGKGEFELL